MHTFSSLTYWCYKKVKLFSFLPIILGAVSESSILMDPDLTSCICNYGYGIEIWTTNLTATPIHNKCHLHGSFKLPTVNKNAQNMNVKCFHLTYAITYHLKELWVTDKHKF